MSKQNLVILIVVIISLVLGGLFGFYFYLNHKSGGALSLNGQNNNVFNLGGSTQTPKPSTPSDTSTTTPEVTTTVPRPIPRLRHLTEAPVAGFGFINKDIISTSTLAFNAVTQKQSKITTTIEVFRWIDRATGHIFETSSSTLETTRISNTTIPKVYEAFFADSKGQSLILRDLIADTDVIRTRYGSLQPVSATSSEQAIKLNDLQNNITSLAISPAQDKIFSILPTSVRGILSKTDGSSPVNLFNTPFHEWLVSWPLAQTLVLNTKPSGVTDGYAYTLDIKSGSLVKLVGNKKGLTTLMSPDGLNVLVGESPLGTTQLDILNRKTGQIRNLFVRTFPDKCVWSKKETNIIYCAVPDNIRYDTYPDAWYMGRINFSDSLWRIDTSTGQSSILVQPVTTLGQPLDMMNLSLNSKEEFIMFQDKNDLSLWSYQLSTTVNSI